MESVEEVKLCKATTKFKGTKNFNKTKDENNSNAIYVELLKWL